MPNSTFTDSSIIGSINENLISEISINQSLVGQSLISQSLISQSLISQNSSATTLALSPISDISHISAPTNIAASNQDKDLNQLNISSPIDLLCPINRPTITSTSPDNSNQLIIPSPINVSVSNPLSISHLDNHVLHNSLLEQSHLDNSCLEQPYLDLQNDNTLNLSSLPSPNNPSITNTPSITNSNLTDLNQLNCSSIDSIVPITNNLLHSLDCSSMSNIDNISSTSNKPVCSSSIDHLHQQFGIDPHSSLGIESPLDLDTQSLPDPDPTPSQFYVIDDGSIDPNLIVSIPSHLLYPQDPSYSHDDYNHLQDLENFQTLDNFNQINTFCPIHQLNNNVTVLDNNHHNQALQSHNHHSEVLKRDDINQVLENNPTNSNNNFSDLISSLSDNNCSSPRHSHIADLDNSDPSNRDFP